MDAQRGQAALESSSRCECGEEKRPSTFTRCRHAYATHLLEQGKYLPASSSSCSGTAIAITHSPLRHSITR